MASLQSNNEERLQQLKAFDESRAGVKGIIDAGITKVPSIFIQPLADEEPCSSGQPTQTRFKIPVVDMADIASRRAEVMDGVRHAAEIMGLFQVVNHGIPTRVLEEMKVAVRKFHELPSEVKAGYYSREHKRRVKYTSSFDLYEASCANWRDTLSCEMEGSSPIDPQELPSVCRDITMEYCYKIYQLAVTMFELFAESLGLKSDHFLRLDCAKGHSILSHYYPPCPEPKLTIGTHKHTDPDILTIILQDHIGGLQVLHHNQWIDVPPLRGALIINVGDLLQLITNGRFKSVIHRVITKTEGPRISVSSFFIHLALEDSPRRLYRPIKELTSEENPPIYQQTTAVDFIKEYRRKRGVFKRFLA